MKIATWNCNSVRARKERLLAYLGSARPDVLCLQELKCQDEQFPAEEVRAAGYHVVCHGQKTYNGVAILSLLEPTHVLRGLADGGEDEQARLVAATVGPLRVVSVYAPNGQAVGTPAYEYKLAWFERLRRYLDTRHQPDELLALCGDWNVAPEPIDVHDPALWEGKVLFSGPERQALRKICAFGLTDAFRLHHPGESGHFTWWDYRMLAFPKNLGLRIDHLLLTPPVADKCTASGIDRDARKGKQPSDHAPVWAKLTL